MDKKSNGTADGKTDSVPVILNHGDSISREQSEVATKENQAEDYANQVLANLKTGKMKPASRLNVAFAMLREQSVCLSLARAKNRERSEQIAKLQIELSEVKNHNESLLLELKKQAESRRRLHSVGQAMLNEISRIS